MAAADISKELLYKKEAHVMGGLMYLFRPSRELSLYLANRLEDKNSHSKSIHQCSLDGLLGHVFFRCHYLRSIECWIHFCDVVISFALAENP